MIRNRYVAYCLLGVLFGISDWYFIRLLMWFLRISNYNTLVDLVSLVANWGIWLVPAIPIALYEVRRTAQPIRSTNAVICVWMSAIVAYYLYYAFLLAFVGVSQMEHLLVFSPRSEVFWRTWPSTFQTLIINPILEWGSVALVGGALVGWLVATLYLRTRSQPLHTHPMEPHP